MTTAAEPSGDGAPPGSRPLERLEEFGESVGRLIGRATRSARRVGGAATGEGPRSAAERAEALTNRIEHGLSKAATWAGWNARRAVARIREEAEDIRAEAEAHRAGRRAGPEEPTARPARPAEDREQTAAVGGDDGSSKA